MCTLSTKMSVESPGQSHSGGNTFEGFFYRGHNSLQFIPSVAFIYDKERSKQNRTKNRRFAESVNHPESTTRIHAMHPAKGIQ